MSKSIVILGTLDTKGEHLHLLKKNIEKRGHRDLILDLSMGSVPALPADIPAAEVPGRRTPHGAARGGTKQIRLHGCHDSRRATESGGTSVEKTK